MVVEVSALQNAWPKMYVIATWNYYRPAKLQESNVFTHVCLFTAWGPYVTITNDALYLTVQAPPQPKSVVVL